MSFSLNVEKKFFNETLRLIKIFFLNEKSFIIQINWQDHSDNIIDRLFLNESF